MKTIKDVVLEHAEEVRLKGDLGTGRGMDFLNLEYDPKNYSAGNLYISALEIIVRLNK